MATVAFIFVNPNGAASVCTMGALPIVGAICGGEFTSECAARMFLESHGFKLNAAGSWER